jgi:hypothetical protein
MSLKIDFHGVIHVSIPFCMMSLKVMIAFVAPKKRKPTTPAIDVKINCPVFA